MKTVEVCLTPELIHQFDLNEKIVVVVDIFRATSCMVAGLATGIDSIHPVSTVQECLELGKKGMITAGERGGKKLEEFDMGNSPFEYMNEKLKGKSVAVSTTNGTLTIKKSLAAKEILIGSFLNIDGTADYIKEANCDLIIHCAGWKGTVNIEDSLYAGALIDLLGFVKIDDAAYLVHELFLNNRDNLLDIGKQSSHAKRLAGFGIQKDIEFCLSTNKFEVVCGLKEGKLICMD